MRAQLSDADHLHRADARLEDGLLVHQELDAIYGQRSLHLAERFEIVISQSREASARPIPKRGEGLRQRAGREHPFQSQEIARQEHQVRVPESDPLQHRAQTGDRPQSAQVRVGHLRHPEDVGFSAVWKDRATAIARKALQARRPLGAGSDSDRLAARAKGGNQAAGRQQPGSEPKGERGPACPAPAARDAGAVGHPGRGAQRHPQKTGSGQDGAGNEDRGSVDSSAQPGDGQPAEVNQHPGVGTEADRSRRWSAHHRLQREGEVKEQEKRSQRDGEPERRTHASRSGAEARPYPDGDEKRSASQREPRLQRL